MNNRYSLSGSLNMLYQSVGISKQAVHQYLQAKSLFEEQLCGLLVQVDELRSEHPGCGVRKMYDTLKPDFVGRDQFIALMMGFGYRLKRTKSYVRTTFAGFYKYPNYIEGCIVYDINQVWQSDITYILIGENFFYLVFIIDVYSRRIVGHAASDHMRSEANLKALELALKVRKGNRLDKLVHHSDRGSQYISDQYTNKLKKKGITISMGLIATDNAFAERVNGIIKNEYLNYWDIKNLGQLQKAVQKAVSHYNTKRIHRGLPKSQTPINYEKRILNLSPKNKDKVLIHTMDYPKINKAFDRQSEHVDAHNCPICCDDYLT